MNDYDWSQDYVYQPWWGWCVASGLNPPNTLKQRYVALTPEEITAMVSRVEVIAQSWWSWWYRLFNIRNYAIERFLVAYHSAKEGGEKDSESTGIKKTAMVEEPQQKRFQEEIASGKEVIEITEDTIKQARLLGMEVKVGDIVKKRAVDKAFRTAAALVHPDKEPIVKRKKRVQKLLKSFLERKTF